MRRDATDAGITLVTLLATLTGGLLVAAGAGSGTALRVAGLSMAAAAAAALPYVVRKLRMIARRGVHQ